MEKRRYSSTNFSFRHCMKINGQFLISTLYPSDRRLGGLQSRSEHCSEGKLIYRSENQNLTPLSPNRVLVTILPELFQLSAVFIKPRALCESLGTLTAFDLLPSNGDVKVILLDDKTCVVPYLLSLFFKVCLSAKVSLS